MNQTKLESFIETCVNTVVGFVVSFVAWPLIAWKCEMAYDSQQHWEMIGWFTILSVARGYAVRRWFNSYFRRFAAWLVGCQSTPRVKVQTRCKCGASLIGRESCMYTKNHCDSLTKAFGDKSKFEFRK